jgi:crooked neck
VLSVVGTTSLTSPRPTQRVVLLEAWKSFEEQQGSSQDVQTVQELMPKVMKKWRQAEDGSGLEECTFARIACRISCLISTRPPTLFTDWDMVFADDEKEANPASFKFFQAAQEWSKNRGNLGLDEEDDSDESSDEE